MPNQILHTSLPAQGRESVGAEARCGHLTAALDRWRCGRVGCRLASSLSAASTQNPQARPASVSSEAMRLIRCQSRAKRVGCGGVSWQMSHWQTSV